MDGDVPLRENYWWSIVAKGELSTVSEDMTLVDWPCTSGWLYTHHILAALTGLRGVLITKRRKNEV